MFGKVIGEGYQVICCDPDCPVNVAGRPACRPTGSRALAGQTLVLVVELQPAQCQATGLQQVGNPQAGLLQGTQVFLALLPGVGFQPVMATHLAHQMIELGVGRVAQQAVLGKVEQLAFLHLVHGGLQVHGA